MAMGPERSRPLHNFTLPCELKWGNQKFLRCVKLDSNGEIAAVHRRSNGSSEPSTGRRRVAASAGVQRSGSNDRLREMGMVKKATVESGHKIESEVDEGIASVREKLMFDLQTAADKMKDAILREGLKDEQGEERQPAVEEEEHSPALAPTTAALPESAADPNKPWSLRTRRSACKGPNGFPADTGGSSQAFKVDVMRPPNVSPMRVENKSPILRSGFAAAVGASPSGEKRERAKFSVPLARREIEEDFMAIVGHRPARRPKKRAKLVQKNLDVSQFIPL